MVGEVSATVHLDDLDGAHQSARIISERGREAAAVALGADLGGDSVAREVLNGEGAPAHRGSFKSSSWMLVFCGARCVAFCGGVNFWQARQVLAVAWISAWSA